jgi:hypothetical protein
MKALLNVYGLGITVVMTILLFATFHGNGSTEEPQAVEPIETAAVMNPGMTGALPQVITSINLSKDYDFAGEVLPKDNFDALERLDRELSVNSYFHSSTLLNLKAARRYFPVIEPILKAQGVPEDLKYMAVIESNLRNETSPAGAKGIWQFMKSTGEHYGLEINSEVDERLHLEKATIAACTYLKDYYKQFGSWTLAAAAYNMGGPRVKRLLEEQRASDYYELNLGSETSRYVFRIIAVKEIMQDPVAFGFYIGESDLYKPFLYTTVAVDTSIANWGTFARDHNTTYRMLKVFNPWLMTDQLSNRSKKAYEVKIPR